MLLPAKRDSLPPGGLLEAAREAVENGADPLSIADYSRLVFTFGGLPERFCESLLNFLRESRQQESDPLESFLMGVCAIFTSSKRSSHVALLLSPLAKSQPDLFSAGLYLIRTAIQKETDLIIKLEMTTVQSCVGFYGGSRKPMYDAMIHGSLIEQQLVAAAPPRIQVRRMLAKARWSGMFHGAARALEVLQESLHLIDERADSWAAAKYFAEIAHWETVRGNFRAACSYYDRAADQRVSAGLPEWVDIMAPRMAAGRTYAICKAAGDDWRAAVRRWRSESPATKKSKKKGDIRDFKDCLHEFRCSVNSDIERLIGYPVLHCNREALLFHLLHAVSTGGLPLREIATHLDGIIDALERPSSAAGEPAGDEDDKSINSEQAIFVALKAALFARDKDATSVNLIKDAFEAANDPHDKARISRLYSIVLTSTGLLPAASRGVAQYAASLQAGLKNKALFTDDDALWTAVDAVLSSVGR